MPRLAHTGRDEMIWAFVLPESPEEQRQRGHTFGRGSDGRSAFLLRWSRQQTGRRGQKGPLHFPDAACRSTVGHRPVPVVEQEDDTVLGSHCQVGVTVTVEIPYGQGVAGQVDGKTEGRLKGTITIA